MLIFAIELREDVNTETIWTSQVQIAELFDVLIANINQHLKSIFETQVLAIGHTNNSR